MKRYCLKRAKCARIGISMNDFDNAARLSSHLHIMGIGDIIFLGMYRDKTACIVGERSLNSSNFSCPILLISHEHEVENGLFVNGYVLLRMMDAEKLGMPVQLEVFGIELMVGRYMESCIGNSMKLSTRIFCMGFMIPKPKVGSDTRGRNPSDSKN